MGDHADDAAFPFDRDDELDERDWYDEDSSYFRPRSGHYSKLSITCKRCGMTDLHWEFVEHRWQLWEDDEAHVCDEERVRKDAVREFGRVPL